VKGISGSTRRLVEKLPREIVANILRRNLGEWGHHIPREERVKPKVAAAK
jgi:hypothetical protein